MIYSSHQKHKSLDQTPRKMNWFVLQGNIALLTHGRALMRTLIAIFSRDWKVFSCMQSKSAHIVFGQCTFPISLIMLLSARESGLNARHIVITLTSFTPVCNLKSILVEMVNFAMVKVDNLCKTRLIAV